MRSIRSSTFKTVITTHHLSPVIFFITASYSLFVFSHSNFSPRYTSLPWCNKYFTSSHYMTFDKWSRSQIAVSCLDGGLFKYRETVEERSDKDKRPRHIGQRERKSRTDVQDISNDNMDFKLIIVYLQTTQNW